jgi:hypothetical protein
MDLEIACFGKLQSGKNNESYEALATINENGLSSAYLVSWCIK